MMRAIGRSSARPQTDARDPQAVEHGAGDAGGGAEADEHAAAGGADAELAEQHLRHAEHQRVAELEAEQEQQHDRGPAAAAGS